MLARHPPKVALGKLTARAVPAVYLHKSTRTEGATLVGLLDNNRVRGRMDRRTLRAVLGEGGCWAFPKITCVDNCRRGPSVGENDSESAERCLGDQLVWDDGDARSDIRDACHGLSGAFLCLQDEEIWDTWATTGRATTRNKGRAPKSANATRRRGVVKAGLKETPLEKRRRGHGQQIVGAQLRRAAARRLGRRRAAQTKDA